MSLPRASRLNEPTRKLSGFLVEQLPYGSLQRRLAVYIGIPFVALLIVVGIVDKVVMPSITRQGTEFELPDLTGQRISDAQTQLEKLGLTVEVASEEYAPGKEQGVILNQYPIGGTKVKSNRSIKFVISLGTKLIRIPQVAGKSVRQAILDLESAQLKLGEIAWAFSDTIPERIVVFSYPAAETEIPIGSPVNLMVNRGRASTFTYMPALVGVPLHEARTKLEEKSLRVGVITYRTDENYLPETVLESSEAEGTELDVGTEIDLVVSSVD